MTWRANYSVQRSWSQVSSIAGHMTAPLVSPSAATKTSGSSASKCCDKGPLHWIRQIGLALHLASSAVQDLLNASVANPCVFAGLAGERTRWESSIGGYEKFLASLPGDTLLAAAFMSYAGPFPSEFREELVKGTWMPQVGPRAAMWPWV